MSLRTPIVIIRAFLTPAIDTRHLVSITRRLLVVAQLHCSIIPQLWACKEVANGKTGSCATTTASEHNVVEILQDALVNEFLKSVNVPPQADAIWTANRNEVTIFVASGSGKTIML